MPPTIQTWETRFPQIYPWIQNLNIRNKMEWWREISKLWCYWDLPVQWCIHKDASDPPIDTDQQLSEDLVQCLNWPRWIQCRCICKKRQFRYWNQNEDWSVISRSGDRIWKHIHLIINSKTSHLILGISMCLASLSCNTIQLIIEKKIIKSMKHKHLLPIPNKTSAQMHEILSLIT